MLDEDRELAWSQMGAGGQAETLTGIKAACPEMTALPTLIRSFAAMLTLDPKTTKLQHWIAGAREADLPCLQSGA